MRVDGEIEMAEVDGRREAGRLGNEEGRLCLGQRTGDNSGLSAPPSHSSPLLFQPLLRAIHRLPNQILTLDGALG